MARRGQPRLTPNRHGRHGGVGTVGTVASARSAPATQPWSQCARDVHYRKGFRHHAVREMCTAATVLDPTRLKVTEPAPTAPVYPSKPYSPVLDGCRLPVFPSPSNLALLVPQKNAPTRPGRLCCEG
jgi:hypothetical protein